MLRLRNRRSLNKTYLTTDMPNPFFSDVGNRRSRVLDRKSDSPSGESLFLTDGFVLNSILIVSRAKVLSKS